MKSMVLSLIQARLVLEIQIYKWTDQKFELKSSKDQSVLQSPPKITQEKDGQRKLHLGSLHTTQINLVEFGKIIIRSC